MNHPVQRDWKFGVFLAPPTHFFAGVIYIWKLFPLCLGAAQLLAGRVHQHEVRVRAAGDHAVASLLQAGADHPGVGHNLPLVLPEHRTKSVALLDSGGIFVQGRGAPSAKKTVARWPPGLRPLAAASIFIAPSNFW